MNSRIRKVGGGNEWVYSNDMNSNQDKKRLKVKYLPNMKLRKSRC